MLVKFVSLRGIAVNCGPLLSETLARRMPSNGRTCVGTGAHKPANGSSAPAPLHQVGNTAAAAQHVASPKARLASHMNGHTGPENAPPLAMAQPTAASSESAPSDAPPLPPANMLPPSIAQMMPSAPPHPGWPNGAGQHGPPAAQIHGSRGLPTSPQQQHQQPFVAMPMEQQMPGMYPPNGGYPWQPQPGFHMHDQPLGVPIGHPQQQYSPRAFPPGTIGGPLMMPPPPGYAAPPGAYPPHAGMGFPAAAGGWPQQPAPVSGAPSEGGGCLLYTSPSPRD